MSNPNRMQPLVITDCDEVLLRMVYHFRAWLRDHHEITMTVSSNFSGALRHSDGRVLEQAEVWRLLGGFFDSEMHRQDEVPGAIDAIRTLNSHAEVVVLTNLNDERREDRIHQLATFGIDLPVYTNQGPKGPALARIVEERGYDAQGRLRPVFFIDDLAVHHGSVAETVPHVTRLHFVGEPEVAPHTDCAFTAGHAHARIDNWQQALPWLLDRIKEQA
ncbi:HAD family hydrolase [Croceicoccus sp. Ery15]|uniref:HAD family hydrolase n=1 Tax=Croceicoccus sp. Ery15 TaxID=1703338 RepID=UPI001E4D700D|nr:HAD family hydrolase [Croceicoccus sp. Ery15]